MDERSIEEIVAEHERREQENAANYAAHLERTAAERAFEESWKAVYSGLESPTEEAAREIAGRLVALVPAIRTAFWDFRIAERLIRKEVSAPYTIAVRILAFACIGNWDKTVESVTQSKSLFGFVASEHREMYSFIRQDENSGLPHTPHMALPELAAVVGESRAKIRGDYRAGRWRTLDSAKYMRLRRWRNSDPSVQEEALKRIREKDPEKMWSKLK